MSVTVGGSADPHWSLTGANIPSQGQSATVLSGGALYGTWPADTAQSGWIGVVNSETQPSAPYTFTESFSMAGLQLSSAVISGFFGALMITVNFLSMASRFQAAGAGGDNPYWGHEMLFTVPDADLVQGINTISLQMQTSDDNYDGIRVEFDTATANAITNGVPDASSTALLLGVASAALAAARRMKRRT